MNRRSSKTNLLIGCCIFILFGCGPSEICSDKKNIDCKSHMDDKNDIVTQNFYEIGDKSHENAACPSEIYNKNISCIRLDDLKFVIDPDYVYYMAKPSIDIVGNFNCGNTVCLIDKDRYMIPDQYKGNIVVAYRNSIVMYVAIYDDYTSKYKVYVPKIMI